MNKRTKQAFRDGHAYGRHWIGPNGDGTLGNLSLDFIAETAECVAAGRPFRDLRDGPTRQEIAVKEAYIRGFLSSLRFSLAASGESL